MGSQFLKKNLGTFLLESFCALSLLGSNTSLAAPSEQPVQTLTRTIQSGLNVQGTLTKNQFRQEAYEENYEVQVPYQDTETYTVQVPYQDTETYYESVPYQEQEEYIDHEQRCDSAYRCHDVPSQECGYENVCRTVPGEPVCHTERICRPVPGQEQCEEATECGTNAQGQQICKTRKVCHQGPGGQDCGDVQRCDSGSSREECHSEQRCHNTTKQECGNEQVCESVPVTKYRTVTKYRQEQRTREVTKYRDEERTREVTRYRTETRCCVTKYRDVFDHQDTLNVLVRFPQSSELLANEKEQIKISFVGDANHPDVTIEDAGTILGYRTANKIIQGTQATIDLALTAKFSAEQVGEKSISALKLMIKPQGAAVSLTDSMGAKTRLVTQFAVVIRSKDTGAIVSQAQTVGAGSTNVVIPLPGSISADQDYSVELTVQRSGIVLAAPVSFAKTAEFLFDRIDSTQLGRDSLKSVALTEKAQDIVLSFVDQGADSRFETNYRVTIVGETDGQVVFSKDFNSEEILKADRSATIAIPGSSLNDSQNYLVTLGVSREGHALSAPVKFETQGKYARLLNPAPYSDESLVGNLDIQGGNISAILSLKDTAPAHPAVTKTYRVQLQRQAGFLGLKKETFFEKTLTADQVKIGNAGIAKMKMTDLGVDSGDLSKYVRDGKTVFVNVSFIRQSPRLNNGQAIVIEKNTKVRIQE